MEIKIRLYIEYNFFWPYSASTWAGSPITIHCPFGVTVNLPLESSLELDILPNKLAEGPKASQGFWQLKVQITKIPRKQNLNISAKNKKADLGHVLLYNMEISVSFVY